MMLMVSKRNKSVNKDRQTDKRKEILSAGYSSKTFLPVVSVSTESGEMHLQIKISKALCIRKCPLSDLAYALPVSMCWTVFSPYTVSSNSFKPIPSVCLRCLKSSSKGGNHLTW